MKNVYIVGGGGAYADMFRANGWNVTNFDEAEYVQFTGGEDVTPSLYGEDNHQYTSNNPRRDGFELEVYRRATEQGKKKLGICRGSQFLSVMSGHSLWQHVDNHAVGGGHIAFVEETEEAVKVSSTHHQMIRLDGTTPYKLLMSARLSTQKEHGARDVDKPVLEDVDVESVFFPEANALSFQPHPEFFTKNHECQRTYFRFIEENFG